ncbi:MAG: hypothetical protein NZ903_00760 [Candidatus Micrarchaeota archaeon]|nr:hypothetical protein [Candidatus Micrarchaeota archaeon]
MVAFMLSDAEKKDVRFFSQRGKSKRMLTILYESAFTFEET